MPDPSNVRNWELCQERREGGVLLTFGDMNIDDKLDFLPADDDEADRMHGPDAGGTRGCEIVQGAVTQLTSTKCFRRHFGAFSTLPLSLRKQDNNFL